jgi:hypothetical protein
MRHPMLVLGLALASWACVIALAWALVRMPWPW